MAGGGESENERGCCRLPLRFGDDAAVLCLCQVEMEKMKLIVFCGEPPTVQWSEEINEKQAVKVRSYVADLKRKSEEDAKQKL